MNRLRSLSFLPLAALAAFLATTTAGSLAHADVLPQNDCTTAPGTPCSTAGPSFDQEGICTSETCHSGSGGSFACVLCELVDGGADSGASAPDAAAPDAAVTDAAVADATVHDAAPSSTSLGSDSKSCAVSPALGARGGDSWAFAAFGLGALGLIAATRSRRHRKE